MDIYIQNIQKGKHGSDTGAYDAQGRSVLRAHTHISNN
jgi:peroxygenase